MENLSKEEIEELRKLHLFLKNEVGEQYTDLHKFELKKQVFIFFFLETVGNIVQSCRKAKIARKTFYNWKENDEDFRKEIESIDINEILLHEARTSHYENLLKRKEATSIYITKSLGKELGFSERSEHNHNVAPFVLKEERTYNTTEPKDEEN